ncbi:hypothetical protein NDU88_007443 [Pleurodeles waltl]|uniref:Uncharacterized protein n=1 Tax=Pleurodeles waltl TaxID=8319 RepID=A0AAV7NVZ3_PLEWA|nr:hypothetical protein NDU88_007443 [Pleurodeles waltl]
MVAPCEVSAMARDWLAGCSWDVRGGPPARISRARMRQCRPQPSSGPQEATSGHLYPRQRDSPDAAAPYEHPAVLQGGRTGPKCLPTRSVARHQVERLS